jgi:hypothetical protein
MTRWQGIGKTQLMELSEEACSRRISKLKMRLSRLKTNIVASLSDPADALQSVLEKCIDFCFHFVGTDRGREKRRYYQGCLENDKWSRPLNP